MLAGWSNNVLAIDVSINYDVPPALALGFAVICIFSYLFFRGQNKGEAPIKYTCHPPDALKQCEYSNLDLLNRCSLTVSGSSAIQCYAPASGKLLGHINPVTPDGVDRAAKKAATAQRRWCETSFALRRRVLKTLLR